MLRIKKPTPSYIYDVNKSTGALILGKNRLDDYARKFLREFCPEALETPMRLPVEEMMKNAGLKVEMVSLSKDLDVFGCCLLLDGDVDVYDAEKDEYVSKPYEAGTILVDPDSAWAYGEGSRRNTLVHEMLHWEKDRTYFKILEENNKAVQGKLSPIMCRQSRTDYEPVKGKQTKQNELQWLEWQAHKLAPRVLMPREMFRKKALEFLNSNIQSCDELVHQLSEFFEVSRFSVKLRLGEGGLTDRIAILSDYEDVFEEVNRQNDFVPINVDEAFQLLTQDSVLQKWVESRGLIFADGYFVIPDRKYIAMKNGHLSLTTYARKNLPKCVLNIQEHRMTKYKYQKDDLGQYVFLYRRGVEEYDSRILVSSPRLQSMIQSQKNEKDIEEAYNIANNELNMYDEAIEMGLIHRLNDETTSLCQCLWYLIEQSKWDKPLDFHEKTLVHENYYGKIKNNKMNNMKSDTLMAICVGLGLPRYLTEEVFKKSERKLHRYQEPEKTCLKIMDRFPGADIATFNKFLTMRNLPPLGSVDRG